MIEQNKNSINKQRFFTLGQFKIILINGNICNISSRSNKLWNLFKFFLINRNKAITPEIILENISPDESYKDPQNVVQNMIYRLRKLLTSESILSNILFSDGSYKLEIQDDTWLDFVEFEEWTSKAGICKKEKPLEAIEYYKNALDIYGGELFPELIYGGWVIPKRTYYSSLYLQSVLNLSKLYANLNAYDLIIPVCQKAIVIEPYEEEIHIQLMENLLKIGKIKDARKHYEETVSLFEKEFGITPTPEMQKIYQLLKTDYIQEKAGRGNISKRLRNEEENRGAFYCEYRDFYAIYVVEKRRSERTGDSLCPVCINFDNGKNVFKSNAYKNAAIRQFKKILINSLRRGDMITLINKTQFLILLPHIEYKQVKFVMDRVINQFNSDNAYKSVFLEIAACPSLPQKKR